jgi:hypothetical protein
MATAQGITVKYSAGSDPELVDTSLILLTKKTDNNRSWKLTPQGNGIERSFKFKTFKKTWVGSRLLLLLRPLLLLLPGPFPIHL